VTPKEFVIARRAQLLDKLRKLFKVRHFHFRTPEEPNAERTQ